MAHELAADPASLIVRMYGRVEDECMGTASPGDVDETDKLLCMECDDN